MNHESTRKYLFMWIEAEVFLPFEQKGGSSAETLNIQFPGSYKLEFSLCENVKDGDSLSKEESKASSLSHTQCVIWRKAEEASPDT